MQVFSEMSLAGGNSDQVCVCVCVCGTWPCIVFDLVQKEDCFPQPLRANPIRRRAQHGGPAPVLSEVLLPGQEADRNVFVWRAQLLWNELERGGGAGGPVLMGRRLEFSCGFGEMHRRLTWPPWRTNGEGFDLREGRAAACWLR